MLLKILMDGSPASKILAYFLYKDPSKQNFYEKTCFDFLEKNLNADIFFKLPQNGEKSLFINNGKVSNEKGDTKAIDFFAKKRIYNFFLCAKYTKDDGGAQDHQKEEGCRFLMNAKLNKDKNSYFIFIADGPYYQRIKNGEKVIDSINREINSDKAFAMTSEEFKNFFNSK